MPPAPRPIPRSPVPERAATCLETDEDVLSALRANLGTPLGSPPLLPPAASPVPPTPARTAAAPPTPIRPAAVGASPVIAYRPTLRPPMALLTIFDDGKSDGEPIRLRGNRFVIGRTEGDLLIPHDGMISAKHLEISRQSAGGQQRWVITDLQSTNGLFVRVSRTFLAHQSELLVGKGRYRMLIPSTEPAPTSDFVPQDEPRGTTQAWGNEGGTGALPSLVEIVGNATSNRILLVGAEYWIGTEANCEVCRPNDPFCESRHARLYRDAKGGWHAEQNKSANGLWFRVPQVIAESSVHFQIGEQRFRLKVGG